MLMNTILDIAIKWLVPFVLGGAVSFAVSTTRKMHKRDKALGDGIQCLLRAEIIRYHDKYTNKGYCPIYARESLSRIYVAYHNLGGNDVATDLYKDTLKLPTEAEYKEE